MSGVVFFNSLCSTYRVASVAVRGPVDVVNPAPVVINDHLARLLSAATGSALLPSKRRVGLGGLRANLLGIGSRHQSGEKKGALIHASHERTEMNGSLFWSSGRQILIEGKLKGPGWSLYIMLVSI